MVLLILLASQLLLGLLSLQPLLLQVLQPSLLLSEVLLLLCLNQCLQEVINKTLQGGKRLLFNSDPWPPAEQKLEMPCDKKITRKFQKYVDISSKAIVIKLLDYTHSLTQSVAYRYLKINCKRFYLGN